MPEVPVVPFAWGISSFFGWGIYGLNLMLGWERRGDLHASCAHPFDMRDIVLDPLEQRLLAPAFRRSLRTSASLAAAEGKSATTSRPVLHCLGANLARGRASHDVDLLGSPSIGIVFLEQAGFDEQGRERARLYPLIVAGSTWNRDVVRASGAARVELVLQGVDTAAFHPAPRRNLFADRFVVFSGGKLERRKGQDLVVLAFREFARRHPEALLLTAWASPWPEMARSLDANPAIAPVAFDAQGQLDALAWTSANEIPPHQVCHLGAVANAAMPRILREADVALFPNRCEGGTNLVAMEAMACGVPTILSANTGHLDLMPGGTCYPLMQQTPIDEALCLGWGESDTGEIVELLERIRRDRPAARTRGLRGAEFLASLDWKRQMDVLAELVKPYA